MPDATLTKDEARRHLEEAAFTSAEEGSDRCPGCGRPLLVERRIIHSRAGGIGADWDLAAALAFVDAADEIAWTVSLFGHDLAVRSEGRVVCFAVRRPERRPERLAVRLAVQDVDGIYVERQLRG